MALAINWNDAASRQRFGRGFEWSDRKIQPFRKQREEIGKQLVGRHYGEEGDGAPDRVPINLIELAVNIYARYLSANNPRVLYRTKMRGLRVAAAEHEAALNAKIKRIRFAHVMREITADALMGLGIGKVGSSVSEEVKIEGQTYAYGRSYFDRTDLDDFVYDMAAASWPRIAYAGNFWRTPFDLVKSNKAYDSEARAALEPMTYAAMTDGGDGMSGLSRGRLDEESDVIDYAGLWEIFHPIAQQVTVHAAGANRLPDMSVKPLLVADWNGPPTGPYHLLRFLEVPNNIMPLAPGAAWMDIHDLVNRLARKLGRQAERHKTILGVQAAGMADGERIIAADDGDTIRLDNPGTAQEYTFGGIDPKSLAFMIQLKDLFTYLGGNLDALGGLGPQSDTATQDKLLVTNASRRVSDMQARVVEFTKLVAEDIDAYAWDDPIHTEVLERSIGNNGLKIAFLYGANSRRGRRTDYELVIEPYSQQDYTPASRSAILLQFWREVLLPAAPLMAQQGMAVNYPGLIRALAHYNDLTELDDIVTFSDRLLENANNGNGGGGGGKPAMTERTYTRRNIPGASVGGKDAAMIQALLGAGNGQELSSTLRPTG